MDSATPTLLARDGDLWVFAKPAGYLVHPAGADPAPDLLGWAREAAGAPATLALVHRLDKETSGVVLCASDGHAAGRLGRWFAAGVVRKTYLGLVYGHPPDAGVIDRPLPDARRGRALPATTRFACEERLGPVTLLRLSPETGRKHQLRAHLHGAGHGLVGDARHRDRRARPIPDAPARLWLHALALALPDGRAYQAPLPPELTAHLDALRARFAPPREATDAPGS